MLSEPRTPYRYIRLAPQALVVQFDFIPQHQHRSSIGCVRFSFTVADRNYGPYRTAIITTTSTWQARKRVRVPQRARLLQDQISTFLDRLHAAWAQYPASGEPITAEMIFNKAGLKLYQFEGGPFYVS